MESDYSGNSLSLKEIKIGSRERSSLTIKVKFFCFPTYIQPEWSSQATLIVQNMVHVQANCNILLLQTKPFLVYDILKIVETMLMLILCLIFLASIHYTFIIYGFLQYAICKHPVLNMYIFSSFCFL